MSEPLCIDLFCGLGGWTEGFLAEGYLVVGFDIEQHAYGEDRYPAQLVIQDVLTLHGSQFKNAAVIVASPPCQEYSYMAMPWTRAKAIAAALRGAGAFPDGYKGSRTIPELTALFDACFRIQREASEAAGRHISLVVENVKGAQPWVGKAAWNFGSYYLWGDVPALMPMTLRGHKVPGFRFDGNGGSFQTASVENRGTRSTENDGGSWFNIGSPGQKVVAQNPDGRLLHKRDGHGHTRHLTNAAEHGRKNGGDWFGAGVDCSEQRRANSKSSARKAASARIAKIPFALARFIAQTYYPVPA